MTTCNQLDHVYPNGGGSVPPGTRCACGRRTWGAAPRAGKAGAAAVAAPRARKVRPLRAGAQVLALGEPRVVVEKFRGEDVYRVNVKVNGRTLFERAELLEVR